MGLVELSKHTGLSPALLSKLEQGKLYPTLPTLSRIALVFSVGLDHFLATKKDVTPMTKERPSAFSRGSWNPRRRVRL